MSFFRFKKKPVQEKKLMYVNDMPIGVTIYHENRNNCRVSIGKSGVTIRLSNHMTDTEKEMQTQKFLVWCKGKLQEKPEILTKKVRNYTDGMVLELFDRALEISIHYKKVAKASGSIKLGQIIIVLPEGLAEEEQQQICSMLVAKILAKIYKPIIWNKLLELNNTCNFGSLKSLRLKNNASNWGSCSNKGNINISVRLFLANEGAVNYVLIHELAHLQHQNHSSKFWNLVEKFCPDYEIHEQWLKQNSHLCIV
jgi:predicted metal-dependent hydrolase